MEVKDKFKWDGKMKEIKENGTKAKKGYKPTYRIILQNISNYDYKHVGQITIKTKNEKEILMRLAQVFSKEIQEAKEAID